MNWVNYLPLRLTRFVCDIDRGKNKTKLACVYLIFCGFLKARSCIYDDELSTGCLMRNQTSCAKITWVWKWIDE